MASEERRRKGRDSSKGRKQSIPGDHEAPKQNPINLIPVLPANPLLGDEPSLPDMSNMMAEMSLAESEFMDKLDDIHRWQASTEAEIEPPDERKIQALFNACVGYYSLLLPVLLKQPGLPDHEKKDLDRNLRLLQVWGVSYAVAEGQLDDLEVDASDVAETITMFLFEISSILTQRIPRLTGKWKTEEDESLLHAQEHLERQIASLQYGNQEDSESEDDSEASKSRMQQCLEDIQEYVQLLNELHPSIEAFLDLSEDHSVPTFKDASDRGAYLYFSDIVRTRFSAISEELADALGMLNLERYNRMSAEREANLKTSLDVPETESVAPKTVSFHDSGIGSSVPSANAPSVRTSSLRAPSIRAPSVVASSVSAPSVAASSMFSALAGKSRSRLPSLPKNAGTGSFSCDYCGKQVRYRSKRDWHRHLIKDLRPYSCLDSTCPWSRQVLPGRLDFVEHLATRHQMGPEWKSQYCGLCESWTEAGKIGVCKHFADHLEDIAIAASPLNITSEDGSDVDSVGSHGADQRAKGGLDPIKEDDEDNEKVIAAAGSLRNSRSRDERAIEDILRATGIDVDMTPNCAICNSPPYPECSCESEALDLALKQAEKQALGDRREGARDWVISHSRNHILNAFEKLSSARKQAFAAYLSTLPNYAIFMQYNGHPPIHSTDLSQLKACIIEAQAELKRGINADWRASVLRYPEVLDYFYSLVSLDLPDDSSPAVMHPRITRSANAPVPEASTQTGRRRGQAAQSSTAAESVPESVPGYHSPRYYASPSRTPEYVPIYEPEPASSKKKRRSNRARPPGSKASRSAPGSPE